MKRYVSLLCFSITCLSTSLSTLAQSGSFVEPENLHNLNTDGHDLPNDLSQDRLTLYLCREDGPDGFGSRDIYMATRDTPGLPFGSATNLGPGVNTDALESGACVSADGLRMLFQSDRGGGFGRRDLYVATRQSVEDPFGNVTNLGPGVNTTAVDAAPNLSADGLTLIFFSDRPGGFGGRDLYMATRPSLEAPFGDVTNLGPGVNTSSHEIGSELSADGTTLFFDRASVSRTESGIFVATWRPMDGRFGDAQPVDLQMSVYDACPNVSADWPSRDSELFLCSGLPGGHGQLDIWRMTWRPVCDSTNDTIPPSLSLLGDSPHIHECGDPYVDAGATALDDCDGDLSTTIAVRGKIDVSSPGEYHLTYTAADDSGNEATLSRTVVVVDTAPPEFVCADGISVDCDDFAGAAVEFPLPLATDGCDGEPMVVCSRSPGTHFPIGTTEVLCTATDVSGNEGECSFEVTVLCNVSRFRRGDCNGDGCVDGLDIAFLNEHVNAEGPPPDCGDAGDVDDDDDLDLDDVIALSAYVLDGGEAPPIPGPITCGPDPSEGDGLGCESYPEDLCSAACEPDADSDGVADIDDNCPSLPNTNQSDNDADDLGDICDPDDDNDGLSDDDELEAGLDAFDGDSDGDFISDGPADPDDDGFIEVGPDNCPLDTNSDQLNSDTDALGDVCDGDDDDDGVLDEADNCPLAPNADQVDLYMDGIGDACDPDDDNDDVLDGADNCPLTPNTDQLNSDTDALGDVCDGDDDDDGVLDGADNCPLTPNADQVDIDMDGIGAACDDAPIFKRGDINGDGEVPGATADIVYLANFLFLGGNPPPCKAAADINGDGQVPGSTTDIVYLANFLFLGGDEPPAPGPRECGVGNERDDALGCDTHPCAP